MKKFTKAIATFCAMAMVVSVFSATVFAEDELNAEETTAEAVAEEEQEAEPKVEEEPTEEEDKKDPEELEQSKSRSAVIEISEDDALPVTSGSYKLVADINVTKTFQIEENNANITLDLNGHTITYSGTGSMYIVGKVNGWNIVAGDITLTIDDSVGGGLITVADGYVGGGSTDHWISGSVGTDDNRGGCVLVQNSSTFILNNGTIDGFHSGDEGGAVHCSNGSYFKMYGGKITNCTSANGGAVSVHTSSNGRTNTKNGVTYEIAGAAWIYGGEISGNTATNLGGGIRVNRGDLYLYGGVITGNTVTNGSGVNGGGGIQILKTKKGEQYLKLHGDVKIVGNQCSAEAKRANLFFNEDTTFELDGDLASTAKIAFGEASEKTTVKFFVINGNQYSEDNFICDNSGYVAYYNDSNDAIMMKQSTEPSYDDPSFEQYKIVVGGEIKLVALVDLGSFANTNTYATYSYSYTKSSRQVDVEKTVPFESFKANGSKYEIPVAVEVSCMTAPISITIHYGTSGVVHNNPITIEDYANALANYYPSYENIAKALLTFGGYAQKQLNINTDKLPTKLGVDFSGYSSFSCPRAAYAPTTDPNGAYGGATVSLLSTAEVKLRIDKTLIGDSNPTMTVTYGGSASPVSIAPTTSGNYYVYVIKGPSETGFAYSQYDYSFNYSVGSVSGSYSVLDYLKAVMDNDSMTANMKNSVEAYYKFAKALETV